MAKVSKYKDHKNEISAVYNRHKGRYGYRRITLELRNQGRILNHKTVLRLMNELGIHGKMKRVKYRSYKGQVGTVAPNHLDRNFVAKNPYKKLTTDVTQFSIASGKVFLSPIQDLFNGEIISYSVTQRPAYSQIEEMLSKAFEIIPNDTGALLHSDQGWQYQMNYYQKAVRNKGLIQSMSRKGNCLDNSPMESFFGTIKNEMFYGQEKEYQNYTQLKKAIDEYIYYYNNDRIKEKLKGLSPVQYRIQSLE
jgi:putative transposase